MSQPVLTLVLLSALLDQATPNRVWEEQYRTRSTADMVAQFESPTRPVYRYRTAIVGMLQLKPGMTAVEIGAGSGFLARMMAAAVGGSGQVVATELDQKMVDHMIARARAEGLQGFRATLGQPASTGLEPASADAVALVNTFSYLDRPREMLTSIAATLKPGGLLLVVDIPREGQGASQVGVDADDVVAMAASAGLKRLDEISVVPGQYSLRFRKSP